MLGYFRARSGRSGCVRSIEGLLRVRESKSYKNNLFPFAQVSHGFNFSMLIIIAVYFTDSTK